MIWSAPFLWNLQNIKQNILLGILLPENQFETAFKSKYIVNLGIYTRLLLYFSCFSKHLAQVVCFGHDYNEAIKLKSEFSSKYPCVASDFSINGKLCLSVLSELTLQNLEIAVSCS